MKLQVARLTTFRLQPWALICLALGTASIGLCWKFANAPHQPPAIVSEAPRAEPDGPLEFAPILSSGSVFDLQGIKGKPPIRQDVLAIRPVTPEGPTGNGSMHLRWLQLIAPRGVTTAVIGAQPSEAPPGYIPAPILIEDCILDESIHLAPSVTVGNNVVIVHVERR
jgi:hypothetical protein